MDTALEGKEPGCGSGCRDRSGTEGTTEGQPTQGREWCFIGQSPRLPSKQAWRFPPVRRGYVHLPANIIILALAPLCAKNSQTYPQNCTAQRRTRPGPATVHSAQPAQPNACGNAKSKILSSRPRRARSNCAVVFAVCGFCFY